MKMQKKNFTLFELLISIALLVVLSVVLLRTMVLTADFWHYSNEQTNLYLDSKIVFNMLGEEISNIVYDYKNYGDNAGDDNVKLVAPVYFQDTAFSTGATGFNREGSEISHGKALYFVSHTRRDNADTDKSDICKVTYKYYPPLKEEDDDVGYAAFKNNSNVPNRGKNGVLVRKVVNIDDSSLAFEQEMKNFFNTTNSSGLKEVIEGVIDFRIHFYEKDNVKPISFPKADDGKEKYKDFYEKLVAIRVSMTLLPINRMEEFRKDYLSASDDDKRHFLLKYSRTFSRTFWVNPAGDIKEGE